MCKIATKLMFMHRNSFTGRAPRPQAYLSVPSLFLGGGAWQGRKNNRTSTGRQSGEKNESYIDSAIRFVSVV